jgi:hypothetical protein
MTCKVARIAAACCLIVILLGSAREAYGQSSVGSGPLTGTLTDTEPQSGVFRLGRIRFAPGITVREIGWDSNVFDEPPEQSPKEDYVAAVNPDVSAFALTRFVRLSAYAGSELTYYQTYSSERSTGYATRGRFDFLLSRVRPFLGLGRTKTRTRPNGEIDVRADRVEEELSGGLAFDLGPHSVLYGSYIFSRNEFVSALQSGIDLGEALTRHREEYQAGIRTDLTPLLSMQVYASFQDDKFKFEPLRNTESTNALATFRMGVDAIVTGTVTVGYRDMIPVDPLTKHFRGFVGSAAITYPVMEVGRLTAALSRGTEYSFDAAEAYYLENSATIAYTHRLWGAVDVQARGSRSLFNYSARLDNPPRTDTMDTAAGSVGYNLRNRTRIAVNYEYARRRSPEFASRNYDRRRVYLSWLFAF